jgi:hypothetical protein
MRTPASRIYTIATRNRRGLPCGGAIVMDTAAPKRLCVACRTPLEAGATICPTCKSWQKQWKNTAFYYGSNVAALALLLSAATYVGNNLLQALSRKDDAEVLEFAYPGNQVYANLGTSDVFLSYVSLYWSGGKWNASFYIDQKIESGAIYFRKPPTDDYEFFHHHYRIVGNTNGDGTSLLPRASLDPSPNDCYQIVIVSPNNFAIKQFNNANAGENLKLAVAEVDTATLYYYTGRRGQLLSKIFPTVITFVDLERPSCHGGRAR